MGVVGAGVASLARTVRNQEKTNFHFRFAGNAANGEGKDK